MRRAALEEAAVFVETQRGGFTRNEVDLLHALAQELRALADKPAEPLGCRHGRAVGQPCPHCMGIGGGR